VISVPRNNIILICYAHKNSSIIWRRRRWVGHVACTGKEKYMDKVGKSETQKAPRGLKCTKWVVAIKMYLEETGWKVVDESG
jgi:hypothetical protein